MQTAYGPGRPTRTDRVHKYVTAWCPHCHAADGSLTGAERLAGVLLNEDGQLWLQRGCPEHGLVRTLYDERADIVGYLERWQAPTKQHVPDDPTNFRPIPEAYAYGLPPTQTQHTCILLEDVIEHCNLRCPTCFTASGPALKGVASVEDILASVDTRLEREGGKLDVLMLSGGEPTLHPQFAELMDELVARPIVRIMVNTNGLVLAEDDALLAVLKKHRQRAEVYLQYDGPSKEAGVALRGGDLRARKDRTIERLAGAGVFVTLVMTIVKGLNDADIGAVLTKALETPFVGGVALQPVFGSGRNPGVDPNSRVTHGGTLARMGEQTGGVVNWHDLIGLPCSHPHCASVGYMIKGDDGTWRSLVSIMGHDQLAEWLQLEPELIANRLVDTEIPEQFRELMKTSLLDLMSEQTSLTHPRTFQVWRDICTACDLGISTMATLAASRLPGQGDRMRRLLAERVKRITVKPFMDINTMLEERLTQCCVHVGTKSAADLHQCAPFCAVQAWPELGAQRLGFTQKAQPLKLMERSRR
ncbi:radical SAM protein [Tessaracoccus massiliensis]|uniref:radical SAM protein n=1 Tax=Tessaracoccus massiliensis TaxID=1522311 RepID=UPI0005903447|nr:radical SAM protein [Tessaracoccus massiliensis]